MTARWEYRVAVAAPTGPPLDWVTYSDDPKPTTFTTRGVSGLLLDGLKLVRKLPEDEPWPCQPTPATFNFQVAAATASELGASVLKGAAVAGRIGQDSSGLGGGWVLAELFTGSITSVALQARDGYTVATVTALGWIATLGEVIIGDDPWPLEAAQNRINRVMEQVAEHAPELPSSWDYAGAGPVAGSHVAMTDADVDARPALEVLLEVLACWPLGEFVNPSAPDLGRWILDQYHATEADDRTADSPDADWPGPGDFTRLLKLDGWRLRQKFSAPNNRPQAVLGVLPSGLWGILMSPTPGRFLPASAVELPVDWAQRIGDIPNTAVVTAHFEGYVAGQEKFTLRWALPVAERKPRVRIARTVPLEVSTTDDATYQSGVDAVFKLAMLLIPNTIAPRTSWVADELTWHASAEDDYRGWPFGLGELCTITDVDPASHPFGKAWIHGMVNAYTVEVKDGFPEVTFQLMPQWRDSIHAEVLQLGQIPATHPTLAELDPAMTLNDTRLLRTT